VVVSSRADALRSVRMMLTRIGILFTTAEAVAKIINPLVGR